MRLRPTLLQRYVLIRSLAGVGAAMAVISLLIFLVTFVELSRNVGVRAKDASVPIVFGLTLLQSPSTILIMLPFGFLFGVLAAFVNLNRRSELTAMRAAGVSAWRFIAPAAAAAAAIGVITVLVLNPAASALNGQYQRLEKQLLEGSLNEAPKTIWLRQGDRYSQMIIRAPARVGPGVHLINPSFFIYKIDANGAPRFARRIDAREAVLSGGRWRLTEVREGVAGNPSVTTASMTLPSTLNEHTAMERFVSAEAVAFWSLPKLIDRTERAGFSATAYRLRLDVLLATPLLYAAMAVLAAAFSLRLMRLGGVGRLAGAGVALGFLFFFVSQLCLSLGKADVIPPFLAAWAPPIVALLSGLTLLTYTEEG